MWKGKGRSGYGESSTLGDYDDWSCLSRNGKQWKNPITMQTRDLSGADYWHMRKQLTDTYDVPEELHAVNETVSLAHVLPSGKANLAAYGDPVPVRKTASKPSIKDKILPQQKRLTTLRAQMLELELSYKAGELSISEYSLYRDIIVAKIERQEVLYKRAASVKPVRDDEDSYEEAYTQPSYNEQTAYYTEDSTYTNCDRGVGDSSTWLDGISDSNSLKIPIKKACTFIKTVVYLSQKARKYINELKVV